MLYLKSILMSSSHNDKLHIISVLWSRPLFNSGCTDAISSRSLVRVDIISSDFVFFLSWVASFYLFYVSFWSSRSPLYVFDSLLCLADERAVQNTSLHDGECEPRHKHCPSVMLTGIMGLMMQSGTAKSKDKENKDKLNTISMWLSSVGRKTWVRI